ncbi:hypothetical protein TSUD_184420 [Trifolium subterraneum]|uniref:Uncharacterized protein n=1 Tax=Trifolium subterraneum TaxID=3900 RepID=A0A2Z6PH58_TRISU|nr:hypothetical protein TSUD_184420 [Trifolium subterraneum]
MYNSTATTCSRNCTATTQTIPTPGSNQSKIDYDPLPSPYSILHTFEAGYRIQRGKKACISSNNLSAGSLQNMKQLNINVPLRAIAKCLHHNLCAVEVADFSGCVTCRLIVIATTSIEATTMAYFVDLIEQDNSNPRHNVVSLLFSRWHHTLFIHHFCFDYLVDIMFTLFLFSISVSIG